MQDKINDITIREEKVDARIVSTNVELSSILDAVKEKRRHLDELNEQKKTLKRQRILLSIKKFFAQIFKRNKS